LAFYNCQGRQLQVEGEKIMEITKDTRVSDILKEYGDIADVMEVFGVKRVGGYSLRRMLTKALTVETAARVHRVPLDEFLDKLNRAVEMSNAQ
jgi:virulence-associated protein VapD